MPDDNRPDFIPHQAARPDFIPHTDTSSGAAAAQAPQPDSLSRFSNAFIEGLGANPEKVAAAATSAKTPAGAVGKGLLETGKDMAVGLGKNIKSEWQQPTTGVGGTEKPLPGGQATAARILFPFHLAARGIEGLTTGIDTGLHKAAAGDVAGGAGTITGNLGQVGIADVAQESFIKTLKESASILDKHVAINKGKVGLVNSAKAAGSQLEHAVTGPNGEIGKHAQAVIQADKADLAKTQSEGKVSGVPAQQAGIEFANKTKIGMDSTHGFKASMTMEEAKAATTMLGREGARLERAGKAPEAGVVWAEYNALREATQARADGLGADFGKSWKHYSSEFHNFLQLHKGVFGDLMETGPMDHENTLGKLTGDKYAAQIPEITDWMKKYKVDPSAVEQAVKQGRQLEDLTQQTRNVFVGKLKAIIRHPMATIPAIAAGSAAGSAVGLTGGIGGFALSLIIAGKVSGLLDHISTMRLLKDISKRVGPEAQRVTPAPEGPKPLPQPPTPQATSTTRAPAERRSIAERRSGAKSSLTGEPMAAPEGVERRVSDRRTQAQKDYDKAVSTTKPGESTPGESLAEQVRQARAGKSSDISEGAALREIMADKEEYAKYKAGDQKTRDAMLVAKARQMRKGR